MVIHPKYIGLGVILLIFYLFTLWFETIHKFCLFRGLINILINLPNINPLVKRKLLLKSETDSTDSNETKEPEVSVQFINLCKGFKYCVVGYLLTLGIIPYNFYLMVNPEKNLESFKIEALQFYKKFIEQSKTQ